MDITNFMNWFLNMFLNIFKFIYNTLDSITFNGISLLKYMICVVVLFPILTILFTLVTSDRLFKNASEIRKENKEKRKEDDN